MGYTHYWKAEKPLTLEEKHKEMIRGIFEEYKDIIQYEDDTDQPPLMGDGVIRFNGIEDHGHETFYIELGKAFEFALCKTARKDYDEPVMKCLLVLSTLEGFSFSSDGGIHPEGEWGEALKWAKSQGIEVAPIIDEDGYVGDMTSQPFKNTA